MVNVAADSRAPVAPAGNNTAAPDVWITTPAKPAQAPLSFPTNIELRLRMLLEHRGKACETLRALQITFGPTA